MAVWLRGSAGKLKGEVLSVPVREEIGTELEEQLIIEFYSR
jgi:ribosomal protein S4